MDGFPFSTEVKVRFAETDAQGIAHHASFLVWLEVARVEYLARYAGGYQAIRERGLEALTTEVHVRYHRAAYFDERLTVWARCVDIRGARFRYEYRITRDGRARRRRLHAARDGRSRDLPADARARLARRGGRTARVAGGVGASRRDGSVSPVRLLRRRLRLGFGFGFVPTRTTRVSPLYDVFQVSSRISVPSGRRPSA